MSAPTETNSRYIDKNKSETAESAYLFRNLHISVIPLILKSVFTLNCKHYIRYHNDRNENKTVDIKEFHRITSEILLNLL